MNVQTVLISGKQGAGKTTTSKQLADLIYKFQVMNTSVHQLTFAKHLYYIHDFARNYLMSLGIEMPEHLKKKDGNLLQFLGTDWGRNTIDQDIWVKAAQGEVRNIIEAEKDKGTKHLVLIFSDCRFKNEFTSFPEALRVRLECNRDLRKARAEMWRENEHHASETNLDEHAEEGRFDLVMKTTPEFSVEDVARSIFVELAHGKWIDKRSSIMK